MMFNIVAEGIAVTLFCLVSETLAQEYCSYQTSPGRNQYVECPETCCGNNPASYDVSNVCCGNKYRVLYIPLVVVLLFSITILYICCKNRASRASRREHTHRPPSTSTCPRSNDVIPSVSLNIEPTLPPPYYSLLPSPPPYYTIDSQTGSSEKSSNSIYSDLPPPDYTEASPDHPPPHYTGTSPEGK